VNTYSASLVSKGSGAELGPPQSTDGVDVSLPPCPLKPLTESVSKNYVVHETSQDESATRPPWKDTMAAMFGDHVDWENVKAYVSRGRPMCELSLLYRFYSLLRNSVSSTASAAMSCDGPPSTLPRSSYQRAIRITSGLSNTDHDFEPRICLEPFSRMLCYPTGKIYSFHET
jgi:hypothetical protein